MTNLRTPDAGEARERLRALMADRLEDGRVWLSPAGWRRATQLAGILAYHVGGSVADHVRDAIGVATDATCACGHPRSAHEDVTPGDGADGWYDAACVEGGCGCPLFVPWGDGDA